MTREMMKKLVGWFFRLILMHLIMILIYSVIISRLFAMYYFTNYKGIAMLILGVFSFVPQAVFVGLLVNNETSYTEYRKEMRDLIMSGQFSYKAILKEWLLKETAYKAIIYTLFQFPYMVVNLFGIRFIHSKMSVFMDFYGMDSFFYILTDVPFLAMILHSLTFALINVIVTLIFIARAKGSVMMQIVNDDERITRD